MKEHKINILGVDCVILEFQYSALCFIGFIPDKKQGYALERISISKEKDESIYARQKKEMSDKSVVSSISIMLENGYGETTPLYKAIGMRDILSSCLEFIERKNEKLT